MDQLPRLGKRELICLLSFTCNYVVFVWRGFLFLSVLGMGYVILLWHSLSLPYNYFVLMLNVPVNNFSVMLGRSHHFLGITSTWLRVNLMTVPPSFFRSLQKANSGFDSQSILNNVRIAAELTSISAKSISYRGNYRQVYRGNQSNNFNRFGYNNRFYDNRDRRDDLFQNLQGPRFRNPGRGQYWQQNREQD